MDKYNVSGRTKKVIDIILGLLFIALLGYSFTGAPFHEVAGIVFIAMTIIHNPNSSFISLFPFKNWGDFFRRANTAIFPHVSILSHFIFKSNTFQRVKH